MTAHLQGAPDADMTTDGAGKSGGIIIAGFGGICGCQAQNVSEHSMIGNGIDIENFKMSYTKQILSSKNGRRPLLVSKPRTDHWVPPPGNYEGRDQKNNKKKDPFCSVCVDNLNDDKKFIEDEIEKEVKLLHSRPSVAYRKHSPRNWSQELVLGMY